MIYKLNLCFRVLTRILVAIASVSSVAAYGNTRTQTQNVENIVTIATRQEQVVNDLVGSVSVLSEEQLKLTSSTHIQEALSQVVGVNLHRGSGQEYLPAIRSPVLSGTGACGGFLMAEDGIALRAAGFCNINELFEAHSEIAQRIEVIRGPGTVLYGSNALHGVINVITPNVRDGGYVAVDAGEYDYYRARLAAGSRGDMHSAGIAFSTTRDAGYRDDSGIHQQKLSLRHEYVDGNLELTSGLTMTLLNQETAGYASSYRDSSIARGNDNPEAYRDAKAIRAWTRASFRTDQGQIQITPYVRYTDMTFLQHFLPGTPLEDNGQKSVGIQSAWYGHFRNDMSFIAGIDLEYTSSFLEQAQDAPTQGSAFLVATVPAGKHYDYDVDAWMVAPFFNVDWQVSEKWLLTGGLRFETMEYDYQNNMSVGRLRDDGTACGFGGCRYSRPPSDTDNFDNWSSVLAVSRQLWDEHKAYLRVARAFRAPQATELYRLQRDQEVADLDSEKLDSIEIGIKGATSHLSYALAIYHMEKDNVIYRDSDFFNLSNGETEHQGIELEIAWNLAEDFDLALNTSYARHRYRNDEIINGININGNDVDSAPRHFSTLRLGYIGLEATRIEVELAEMGSYYTDPENLHEYDGHTLLNLRASYSPLANIKLYARLLNATDRDYAERADYTGFSGDRYFPGMPRSLFVGAEYSW